MARFRAEGHRSSRIGDKTTARGRGLVPSSAFRFLPARSRARQFASMRSSPNHASPASSDGLRPFG